MEIDGDQLSGGQEVKTKESKHQWVARINGTGQPSGRKMKTFDKWAVIKFCIFPFFSCFWEPVRTQAVGWLTSTVKQLKALLVHQGFSYIWRLWQEYTGAAGSLQPATRALCSPDIWNSNRGEIHQSSKCYSIYRFDDSCRKHNPPDCLLA